LQVKIEKNICKIDVSKVKKIDVKCKIIYNAVKYNVKFLIL